MIELIPVMLFILGWHPDRPGEIELQRPELLFASVEECEATGADLAARMMSDLSGDASGKSGMRYEARCMPLPSEDEFDAVLRDAMKSHQ